MNDPFDKELNRIDDTPDALPEQPQPLKTHKTQKAYKKLALTMALAASIFGILPASFTAPTIAQALRKNPIIGTVFTLLGDAGLKTADNKGFVSDINQIETDEGLTLKITEALYDGSRLSIGYVVQSTQELNDNTNPQVEFKIDGKRLSTYGAGGHSDFIDKHTYVGVLYVDPADDLPTSFDLDMKFRQLGDVEGRWTFSFPVTEQSADNNTIRPIGTGLEMTIPIE